MSIFEAIILGLVQGLTEFIPVSSSGHLLLTHKLFGNDGSSLAFDVALHVGTLCALIVYFRNDIIMIIRNVAAKTAEGRLARLLAVATLPAALAGFLFEDFIDETLRSPVVVAATLAGVGIVMLLADRLGNTEAEAEVDDTSVTTPQALGVGSAQMLALIPGVSRSGATITAGILLGMGRRQAARFSFLLAMPIIAGSAFGVLVRDGGNLEVDIALLAGMCAAFLSGLAAIKFLLGVIARVGLTPFALYRIALSAVVLVVLV